eukprot:TRINITY_DN19894_c0_g2_i1.p1 TRINITY_DN19894_c0_g2~~TRINITY_DN19894_c0_g2_i1.p1  ORF type:complete len:433 (+),score=98.53 TRINITY_DN19894_c0_g2_i1:138-1436(+)
MEREGHATRHRHEKEEKYRERYGHEEDERLDSAHRSREKGMGHSHYERSRHRRDEDSSDDGENRYRHRDKERDRHKDGKGTERSGEQRLRRGSREKDRIRNGRERSVDRSNKRPNDEEKTKEYRSHSHLSSRERERERERSSDRARRHSELRERNWESEDDSRSRRREIERDRYEEAKERDLKQRKRRPSDDENDGNAHEQRGAERRRASEDFKIETLESEDISKRRRYDDDSKIESSNLSQQSTRDMSRVENPQDDSLARMKAAEEALEAKQKEKVKPSFELSGKLAAETNKVRGITLLFNEPPDARKPTIRWRLYVFKAGEPLNEPLYVHRQSCYLFGRERRVADIPTDHPSCSKQHAVIQFRQVEKEEPDGTLSKQVRPYLMDLGSTNGTFLNDNRLEPQRYYELFEKDTIRFGNSSREYVILHENSVG